ncbi:MAG: hypothetical protein JJLCMIEE_00777 [Acidimicrobiales bacterium]|nr:MAG: hypothetical protein EDR02_02900 [Actinomycetota bacterium]MBV6507722.1 hypothetical protein [Acidimicrobiales bacterium]RIK07647.1 MAG: hypothetical protein DCC48_03915 [Acidobacteriota bacterium]
MAGESEQATAEAGAEAIRHYFEQRSVEPVGGDDGRFTVYVPTANGDDERLQVGLASTPVSRGVVARVKAPRRVSEDNFPAVLWLCNEWNRRNPLPRAALSVGEVDGARVGTCVLEGWLPATAEYPEDQLTRFIDSVVSGARSFWASARLQDLAPVTTG